MRAVCLLAAAILLAGCNSPPAKSDPGVEALFEDTPAAAAGLGLIRGVVVDPALTPISGARVELTSQARETTSDEDGAFVFVDLEPGTYFLSASRPGYGTVQQSTEVRADVPEPPVVKVLLERLPGTEPRVVTLQQEGFIACSIGTPATIHSCDTSGNDNPNLFFEVEGTPRWIQTEIAWESTQPSGDWLYVIQGLCTCEGELPPFDNRFDELPDAQSIHVARADPEFLANVTVGGPDAAQLLVSVSASGPEPEATNGSGLAVNQAFQVFATYFYNFDPLEDWTFTGDGPYPLPPG